jgi:hypothetical protein
VVIVQPADARPAEIDSKADNALPLRTHRLASLPFLQRLDFVSSGCDADFGFTLCSRSYPDAISAADATFHVHGHA